MSWIIGLSNNQHVFNLYLYKTAKTMWECLKKVYNQMNSTIGFQLEGNIYTQGSMSIP